MAKQQQKKNRSGSRGAEAPIQALPTEPDIGGDGFWKRAGERVLEAIDAAPAVLGRAVNRVFQVFLGGTRVERAIKELCPIVDRINAFEAEMVALHDEELREKTDQLRRRVQEDGESLDDILPEAFAVAREACDRRIGMCSVLKPEHEFDPTRLSDANRKLLLDAKQQLEAETPLRDILFPASFYAELRTLFPDYRPPFRMRPYDVQLIGGIVLHQGKIAEMVTGEGKTLVATLPAYLNALAGKHVHVVTVNDYLARRDRDWNAPMYESLGLTVGAIQSDMDPRERRPEYACDITYGTNNEFGFDYLRDNMKDSVEQQAQGPLQYAIIDEVDNILIDEARTPLIISGPAEESSDRYYIANRLVNQLKGVNAQHLPRDEAKREQVLANCDYTYNLKDHSTSLTERGIRNSQKFLGVDNLYHGRNMDWPPFIEAGLKAKEFYKLDVDYVIRDGEVVIVDEFTGRLMPGRRWSDGLHQAVEAKEASRGVRIKEENQTLATITFQNFFRLYDKIAGMTGTALTEAGEFMKIYALDVVPMPTNRPLRRDEHADLIYGSEKEKWGAVIEEIGAVHAVGRPVLVGTTSIENSETISALLERKGIKHEVLNAKHHEREAGIVTLAGQFGAVTVATNMAGRGTDIVLGGRPWPQVLKWWQEHGLAPKDLTPDRVRRQLREEHGLDREEITDEVVHQELQEQLELHWFDSWGLRKEGENNVPQAEVRRRLERYWAERGMAPMVLADNVAEMGGLHIVGTERHEARRIDNQLRGRAGRQGDPGSSRFFVSLDDDLMRIFMGEWVRRFMIRSGLSEGQPLEHGMVSRALERAQRKVEERNFEIRKNLLEYDEVMDEQRKLVYSQRQEILEGGEHRDPAQVVDRAVQRFLAEDLQPPARELPDRIFALIQRSAAALGVDLPRAAWDEADRETLESVLTEAARGAFSGPLSREQLEAWAQSRLDDCRADGEPYPERWHLPRLAGWADDLGLDVSRQALAEAAREALAQRIAEAAREQLGDRELDQVLTDWFVIGYEQDLPLLSPAGRWELDSFRQWLDRLGIRIEIVKWTPATSTCEALLPQWLAAARERFGDQSVPEVVAELAAEAARLYLAWPAFQVRPGAERIGFWAERRLGVSLDPREIQQAYEERAAPALVHALADVLEARTADLSASDAAALWARNTAEWHRDVHLRFGDHNIAALAGSLSARLRIGLNSFHLARMAPEAIREHVLEKVEHRPEAEHPEEHLEGLEDIVFNMVEASNHRLLLEELGDRADSMPAERNFVPLADWTHELGLSISEAEWRAFDLHELRLHLLRQVADAYPAESPEELTETFVPRFTRRAVRLFLDSDGFQAEPSYDILAAWAADRFAFLPRPAQVEAHLQRFAADRLKETRQALVTAKVEEYQHSGLDINEAVEEMVTATLDLQRSFGEADEVDLAGMAAFARQVFGVSISLDRLEDECQGEEREAVRVLATNARGRYAKRGVEKLVPDAVDAVFELCLPAERFPSSWRCDALQNWLRAVGLAHVLQAEDLREETLEAILDYFVEAAVSGHAKRPVGQVRAETLTAALQVFIETDLAAEGRNIVALANAIAGRYGIELDPFELSKQPLEAIESEVDERVRTTYERRKRQLGPRNMLWTVRQLLLQTTDSKWKDHLYNMDHLRGVIGFRGYGQKDPKVEYKREGYEMFEAMTESIEDAVAEYFLKVEFSLGEEQAESVWQADSYIHEEAEVYDQQQAMAAQAAAQAQAAAAPRGQEGPAVKTISAAKEPGRNDPCPCGRKRSDGRPVKYKNCCGKRSKRA
jgi:preprotein translocase subunit SecA